MVRSQASEAVLNRADREAVLNRADRGRSIGEVCVVATRTTMDATRDRTGACDTATGTRGPRGVG